MIVSKPVTRVIGALKYRKQCSMISAADLGPEPAVLALRER